MILFWLFALWGCSTSCEETCDKLISCESVDNAKLELSECVSSCSAREKLYEEWNDLSKREAFDDLKECIHDSECSDVTSGVCYEDAEDLYIW